MNGSNSISLHHVTKIEITPVVGERVEQGLYSWQDIVIYDEYGNKTTLTMFSKRPVEIIQRKS